MLENVVLVRILGNENVKMHVKSKVLYSTVQDCASYTVLSTLGEGEQQATVGKPKNKVPTPA